MNQKRNTPRSLHWGGKGTALLLSLSLCVSLLPGTVYAAGGGNADKTVFDALGFDTKAPEGYEQNEGLADSPYGKTYTTMAEVDELFTFEPKNVNNSKKDTLYYKLFGDNVETLGSVEDTLNTPKGDKKFNMTGSSNGPISLQVEGNFSKDNNGQKKNVAFINISYVTRAEDDEYRPKIDKTKGALVNFDLGVLDPSMKASTNNGKDVFYRASEFSPKYDTDPFISSSHLWNKYDDAPIYLGNSGDATEKTYTDSLTTEKSREFTTAYTAQNYIELAAGDFDGDSIDEIAVYIGETGNPRVEVWKLQEQEGEGYLNPGHYTENLMGDNQDTDKRTWKIAWTYKLNQYGTNVVPNMVSLAADDFNKDGIDDLAVSWGYFGVKNIQPSHAMIMIGADNNKMLTNSYTFPLKANGTDIYRAGFTAGDVDNDGYNELVLGGSLANSSPNSRYLAIYEWDGTGFSVTAQQNFNLFEEENKVRKWQNIKDEKVYYSMPYAPANVAVGNFYGISEAPCIYLDSILIQYGNDGFDILDLLSREVYNPTDSNLSFYYTEWGARAADLTGSGQDVLFTLANAVNTSNDDAKSIQALLRNTFSSAYQNVYALSGISFGKGNDSYTTESIYNPKYSYYSVDDNNAINPASLSFSLPNTDKDTIILKYTSKHYYTYADPEVLAVLASPPYFEDLANEDDDSQMIESATSYGATQGSGEGKSHSNSFSVGVYTSWEKSFKIFNVELFSAEAEASINNTFTWETQKTSSLEYEVTYFTMAGLDTVVLYSMPIESYVYEAIMPDGTTQAMTVNIPYEPSVQTVSLEKYNAIRAGYPDILPDVTKALTHTVGDPGSYASSLGSLPSGRGQTLVYNGNPSTIGQGSQSTQEQSISMTNEETNSFNYEIAVETKAGVGAGGVTVGVTAGYTHGAGKVHISTAGSSYTGTMNGLPSQAEQYGYTFNWKLVGFLFENKYPVVTYLVTQVGEPPLLPKNFGTNEAETTTDQIALEWDYPGNAAGFVLYRYFQSPSASGYYKIGTVAASDYKLVNGVKHYQYIDTGLSPNEGYRYRIQTIGLSEPNTSIPSAAYSTYTKPDSNIPMVSVNHETLAASPDTTVSTTAYITNSDELTGAQIYYQWQKKDAKGAWKDVEGQQAATIAFRYPDADAEGIYRCKVSALINQNLVTAYSPEVLVTFAQHKAEITDLTIDGNTLTATVKGKDVSTVPSGTISFLLKSAGAETAYTATLDSTGKASVTVNPTNGIYKVTANYSGNKVFLPASYDPVDPTFYVKGVKEGSFVDVKDSYTYGDTFAFKKYTVAADGTATAEDFTPTTWSNLPNDNTIKTRFTDGRAGQVGTFSFTEGGTSYTVTVTKKAASITGLESVTKTIADFEADNSTATFLTELKGKLEFVGCVEGWDALKTIGLDSLVIYDSAGNTVNKIQTPGAYTVQFGTSNIQNYDLTLPTAKLIVTGQSYPVEVKSTSPGAYGTVSVVSPKDADSAAVGQTVIFRAVPNDGYMVAGWTVNDTPVANSEGLETLSHIQTNKDLKVTVSFKVKENTLTVSALPQDAAVNGAPVTNSVTANEGSYFNNGNPYATDYEVTFTPDAAKGWHFVGWEYHESGQTPKYSNDDTFTVQMPNRSVHLYAKFERDTYRLTLGEHLTAYVNGEAVTDLNAITGDSNVTVKPAAGYELAEDAKWLVNGEEITPQPNDAHTFPMLADTEVSVDVKAGKYTIELNTDGVTGGTAEASETGEIEGGTEVTFTATPERGYTFEGWKDASGEIISKKAEYTFIVGNNLTLTPAFEEQEAKTITIFAEENGEITWAIDGVDEDESGTEITLYPDETLTLTAKPDSGKMVAGWTINGAYTAKTAKTRTFNYDDLANGDIISVAFKPVTYFDVSIDDTIASSVTAEADGETITDFPAKLPAGCKIIFTYTDSATYVTEWKVNGNRAQGTSESFTIADLAENAEISCETTDTLTFFKITDANGEGEKHYTVKISGTYEEEDAEGNKEYAAGSDVTITVTPEEGYRITDVSSEDNEDAEFTKHNGSWTAVIENLQDNMTYTVAAEKILFTITLDANGGKVSGEDSTTLKTDETDKLTSLPKATRSGYTFDGWFTAENAGDQVSTDTIFKKDTTIYAHWTKVSTPSGGGGGGGGGKVTTPEQPTAPTTPTEPKDDTDNPKDSEETTKNPFLDVADGAYYADAVLWAVKNGITGGTSATTFSPDAPCTRAQAVTFLWRAAGSPAPSSTEMPFADVPADAYYYNAVLWAVENGITGGTSENTFSPDTNCSRGQIVAFLWRSKQSPKVAAENPFMDVNAADYYHDAVLWAAENGITGGTGANAFSPDAPCTRAQIVTFLYRALHK